MIRRPVVLLVVALVATASEAWGQEHLVSAKARVDFSNGDPAQVTITYVVRPAPGTDAVPLAGLLFGGVELRSVRVRVAGSTAPIVLDRTDAGRVTGSIPLLGSALGEMAISLVVSYEVMGASSEAEGVLDARVPILAVTWPPAEALPGTFTAEVLLPGGLTVFESFPADLREAGEAGDVVRYVTELPVLPSLLSIRAAEGGRLLTTTTLMDVAVLILLGSVALMGWAYLRRGV